MSRRKMSTKIKKYEIRRRTEIEVPHRGDVITFIYDKHGPDTYSNVAESITNAGLDRPTMAETASFIHPAFQNDEKEFAEIKELMKSNGLWAFTGSLYVPNKGAYVQDNPEIRNSMPFMEESQLVRKLEEKDPSVRFVPFGFKTERMTSRELAKNPYVIALAGEEGAENLAQVADNYREEPYLWSFTSVDQPLTRVSALASGWERGDRGLGVVGGSRGNDWVGCAFGVRKTGEASRAEK